MRDSAKKMLDSLHHIQGKDSLGKVSNGKEKLQLVHLIIYKAFYTDENGKTQSEDCKLIGSMDGKIPKVAISSSWLQKPPQMASSALPPARLPAS